MPINLNKRTEVKKTKVEELKKALEVGADGAPVNFHWKNEDAKEFIDFVKDESNGLLQKFRVIPMSWPTKEIAKIIDNGKFLRPGWEYKRTGWTGESGYEFGQEAIKLRTEKIEGLFYISDDELADNIEWKKLDSHIRSIVGKKINNELAEVSIYGRKLDNANGNNGILNVFNGVKYLVKESGNVINALDLTSRDITRKTLIKGKKVLKTKYRQDAEILLDSDIKTDIDELYNDVNGNKGNGETIKTTVSWMKLNEVPLMTSENAVPVWTSVWVVAISEAGQKVINCGDLSGSVAVWNAIVVNYGGADEIAYTVAAINATTITVTENLVYKLPVDSTVHKATLDGADIIQGNPKNIIVGIQEDVKVEFERVAPDGYNVWYKMRADIVVENPEAMVLIENLKSKD